MINPNGTFPHTLSISLTKHHHIHTNTMSAMDLPNNTMVVSSIAEAFILQIVIATTKSLAYLLIAATGSLLTDVNNLISPMDGRFPLDQLHKGNHTCEENKDGSETEDDDDDNDDDDDVNDEDDEDDEDFSGDEGDEDADPEDDPVPNGAGGSDDDDEDDDDDDDDNDDDDDGDGEDEDEDEEEDEDEDQQPPSKRKK